MALQERNLGHDMRADIVVLDAQNVRWCTRIVLDSAAGNAPCFGGIFLDNVTYHPVIAAEESQLAFTLGGPKDTTQLWDRWITEQSSDVAYIPPEEIVERGDRSKVDSWSLGCLVVQLLNFGKPLSLKRTGPYACSSERFVLKEAGIRKRLKEFYTGFDKQHSLVVVGPEVAFDKVPYACEDFLAHCLEPVPSRRWTLDALRAHPFVDPNISLSELYAMDEEYYRPLPIANNFKVNNLRVHPYLANTTTTYSIHVGDSPRVPGNQPKGTPVEVWKFQLMEETRDRELYARAYGKLLDLLTLENSNDEAVRRRAGCYRIRALQQGHQNIVHHYGCQFTPRPNTYSMPEFLVFSEHCAGENFQQASKCFVPVGVLKKWIGEALCGLDFLHKHGIVHRNINSSIIFFTDSSFKGTVKIGGFHNMRQLAGDHTQKHEISARHGQDGRFVAPEISNTTNDVNIGRKCDIWSFGCVVLHLVTGHPPLYRGQRGRNIDSEMAVIYHLNHHKTGPEIPSWVPASVRAFIDTCLQFEPDKRPTAFELLQSQKPPVVDEAAVSEYQKGRAGETLPEGTFEYWMNKSE